mgnify:CR=1 FL=1
MIPTEVQPTENLLQEFEVEEQPTKTYYMDLDKNKVSGLTDGQAAMKQAIYKILQTERYQYPKIYSDNYGVELWGLIGQPIAYVIPEIERRITEALTWDERIIKVYNFSFEIKKKAVAVKFYADTVFGTVEIDNVEVAI